LVDARFVLPPEFDRPEFLADRDGCPDQFGKFFLNASCSTSSLYGWWGRAEMRRKFSHRNNLPMLRSWNETPNRASIRLRKSIRRQRTTPSAARSAPCMTQASTYVLIYVEAVANLSEAVPAPLLVEGRSQHLD
jgi:hypothetical protein